MVQPGGKGAVFFLDFNDSPGIVDGGVDLQTIANDARIVEQPVEFSKLVAAGFAQKRKTIANNLKSYSPTYATALEQSEIDPSRRAETLTLEEWLRLHEVFG